MATETFQSGGAQIAFIFDDVAGCEALAGAFRPDVEVHVLDAGQDGLERIAAILERRRDVEALHVLGHGSAGALNLGSLTLDAANLEAHSDLLGRIGGALTAGGDILLYGCNVAADALGARFVDRIARATGADVAASTTPTGVAQRGGDWTLAYATGPVSAGGAFDAATVHDLDTLLSLPDGLQDVTSSMTTSNFVSDFTLAANDAFVSNSDPAGIYFSSTADPSTATMDATLTVAADGSNLSSFDLTGLGWIKYSGGVPGAYKFIVTGYHSDGSTVSSTFTSAANASGFDSTPDYSSFTDITKFDVEIQASTTNYPVSNWTFDSFTIANAAAPDTTPPVFSSATVDGATLVMTYTDASALDAAHAPGAGSFAVTAGGAAVAVDAVAVDANAETVTLTLHSAVASGQAVTVAYTDPTGGNDANAIQDAAGNDAASLSATSVTNTTPDTTPPSISGDIAVPADGAYHAGQTLSFTVTFDENVTVTGSDSTLGLTIGSTARDAAFASSTANSITYAYTVQAGDVDADGVTVGGISAGTSTIRDAAGNDASLTLTGHLPSTAGILVDTAAPDAPSAPLLAAASDTGTSNSDHITSDTTPTLTGTAEAGAVVTLYDTDGTTVLGTTTATGGTWSITSSTLGDGSHTLTAVATDAAGNVSSASSGLAVTIDHTAPTVAITSDHAALKVGETATVTFTFSEDPGSTFDAADVTVSGGTLGALSGTGLTRTATFTPMGGIDSGTASITVAGGNYADTAGNAGGAGTTPSLTYDTHAPGAPTTPAMMSSYDSGISTSDHVTNFTRPTFTGTAEAGAVVTLYDTDGTTVLGTTTATGGTWYINPASPLSEGGHTLTAVATDAAGNVSSASSGLAVTVDTTAPTVAITSDHASLIGGETATITFTFSEDPGATFSWDGSSGDVAVSGGALSAISGSGLTRTAVFTPTAGVDSGTASITIAAGSYTDTAGNTGGAGAAPSLAYDTLAPDAPTTPAMASADDSGISNSDHITHVTTPTFTGTAEAGAVVTLYDTDGTTVLGTTTATGGTWSITSSALGDGGHTLTAVATDAAGNVSSASTGLAVTVDTTAPNAPSAPAMASADDSGTSNADHITSNTTPTLTGTAEAGAVVTLYDTDGTTVLGTTTATGGTWSITSSALGEGGHTLTAKAADAAGNVSSASSGLAVNIDHTAPNAPSAPAMASADDSGISNADHVTSNTTPTFTGTAEAGAVVALYDTDGTTVLGTTTATGGTWSITSSALGEGGHTLTAVATDAAGNVSSASSGLAVAIDHTAPNAPSAPALASADDTGISNSDHVTNLITPTLTGTAEAGAVVTLYDTDGTTVLGTATATGGHWSITASAALGEGDHTLTAVATDAAGNVSSASSGLAVTIDHTAPTAVISMASASLHAGETTAVTITFDEPVSDLSLADLTADHGTLSNLASADGGTTWTATLTPAAHAAAATNHVVLDNTLVQDLAANLGTGTTSSASYAVDTNPAGGGGSAVVVVTTPTGNLVTGNAADNLITSSGGADTVAAGLGEDTILAGSHDDVLQGNAGHDSLAGGGGDDVIHGGQGDDFVHGNAGADMLFGDKGVDTVLGGQGADTLQGGQGNDYLSGDLGDDVVRGGQGDDRLFGGAGDDFLSGDLGDDTLTGGAGADTFHISVGSGVDLVTDFNHAEGDHVLLEPGASYTVSQVGADVHVDVAGGGELVLSHVQLSSLTGAWIMA